MNKPKSIITMWSFALPCLLLSTLLMVETTMAAMYYVKPTGNDAAAGTSEGTAWQHVMKACGLVVAGDTVLIRSGRYDETSNILNRTAWGYPIQAGLVPTNTGTAGHPIVFKGYPGDIRPIIIGKSPRVGAANATEFRMGALLDDDHYLTYDSLEFRFGSTGFFLQGGAPHDIIVRNCVIDSMLGLGGAPTDDNAGGIVTYYAWGTRNCTFEGNHIFACGAWNVGAGTPNYRLHYNTGGIYLYGCDSCLIRNNTIHDVQAGIQFKEEARYTEVYGNVIYNAAQAAMWAHFGQTGIGSSYTGPDHIISRWHNNIAYNTSKCLQVGFGVTTGTNNDTLLYFYNNTCDCGNSAAWSDSASDSRWGGIQGDQGGFGKAYFFNNIFYNVPAMYNADATDHAGALNLWSAWAPMFQLYEDYSILFGQGTGKYYAINSTTYTLAEWKAASISQMVAGQGANTRIGDPLFVNAAAHNYSLGTGSPALTGGKGGSFTFFPGTSRQATVTLPTYLGALGTVDTTWSVGDASAVEGNSPQFIVSLSHATSVAVTYNYATANGTAVTPTNYTAKSGTGTIGAGKSADTVLVQTIDDTVVNPTRTMSLAISAPSRYSISNGTGVGSLLDNDTMTVTLVANPNSLPVGGGSTTLSWTSTKADSVVIRDQSSARITGSGPTSGSTSTALTFTSTYTATAYKMPSTATAQATVTVALPPGADSSNYALGRVATVSGTYTGYTIGPLTDGVIAPRSTATTWASDESALPHWVEIDFGAVRPINGVRLYWAWNSGRSAWMVSQQYTVQSWTGSAYVDIVTVNNPTATDSLTFTAFPTVSTQRIRIYQPANMGPATYPMIMWVTELQIWGPLSDTMPPGAVKDLRGQQ